MALALIEPPVPGITLVQLSYLSWLEAQEGTRQEKTSMFRRYYDGDHDTQLTARMRKFLELTATQEFSLNLCPIVVDALAERLKVSGFACENKPEIFREWWNRNRMDATQSVVHLAGVRDGDAYLLVEWDNEKQRPQFTQENSYDGTQGMHVVYSDECRTDPVVAIKRWIVTSGEMVKTRRCNLYYPDRIEKYTDNSTGKDWQQHTEEGRPWPEPWMYKGEPIGIPVIHWRNKDQGYSHGESELEDVVPIQNGLNKAFIDVLAAADATGFQTYTATGVEKAPDIVGPGMVWWSSNPNAKYDALVPSSLDGLISLVDTTAAYVAKITRTPLSYFQLTGQVAAAGTLKEQRQGLISKTTDRQTTGGNFWEDAMYMGRKLHNAFGPGGLDEKAEITTLWVDQEEPTGEELATEANLLYQSKSGSVRTRVKLLHPGWDEATIDTEVKLIQAETGAAVPDLGPFAVSNA